MSQVIKLGGGGSGSSITIAGDTGTPATGNSFTFNANTYSGAFTQFAVSGTTLYLQVSDANSNTFIGNLAGNAGNTGFGNVAVGDFNLTNLTGNHDGNTAFGQNALQGLMAGQFNMGFGPNALSKLVSGAGNTAIGFAAGFNYTGAESYNIIIGGSATGTGTLGESNVMRLGGAGTGTGNYQINKTFVAGVRGITTVNNDAIAVLIDSTGQMGTVSSSARFKENINDMGSRSNVIHSLRPVTFKYKSHPSGSESVGLIAEEVAVAAPNLVVYDKDGIPETIKYQDLVPMLLNELQKACKRIAALEEKNV